MLVEATFTTRPRPGRGRAAKSRRAGPRRSIARRARRRAWRVRGASPWAARARTCTGRPGQPRARAARRRRGATRPARDGRAAAWMSCALRVRGGPRPSLQGRARWLGRGGVRVGAGLGRRLAGEGRGQGRGEGRRRVDGRDGMLRGHGSALPRGRGRSRRAGPLGPGSTGLPTRSIPSDPSPCRAAYHPVRRLAARPVASAGATASAVETCRSARSSAVQMTTLRRKRGQPGSLDGTGSVSRRCSPTKRTCRTGPIWVNSTPVAGPST